VRTELAEFVERGYWTVLPYRLAQHLPNLRLSPLGVVPQRERKPRLIVDLTFNGVNADTVKTAPPMAMQFGNALHRILSQIRHANPRYGPVHLIKIDISDGFYRIGLRPESAPSLAVVLPVSAGEEPMVAIPLSLPMGWVESPPYFCAATETAADLANQRLERPTAPPHRLETYADGLGPSSNATRRVRDADVSATDQISPASPYPINERSFAVVDNDAHHAAAPPETTAPPLHRTL